MEESSYYSPRFEPISKWFWIQPNTNGLLKNRLFVCGWTLIEVVFSFLSNCWYLFQHNYEYGYAVEEYDEYGNPNVHSKTEVRDGYTVKGQYKVQLPDCRTQIVDYYVDEYQQ